MEVGPTFYQESIEKHAPAVLSCLARLVNEVMLEIARGTKVTPEMRREVGEAIALIMKATAPPVCPVAPQQK